jgi:hypothetical protein
MQIVHQKDQQKENDYFYYWLAITIGLCETERCRCEIVFHFMLSNFTCLHLGMRIQLTWYMLSPIVWGCLRSYSWCLWKAFNEEGCMGFDSMAFGLAVQKFLNIE